MAAEKEGGGLHTLGCRARRTDFIVVVVVVSVSVWGAVELGSGGGGLWDRNLHPCRGLGRRHDKRLCGSLGHGGG